MLEENICAVSSRQNNTWPKKIHRNILFSRPGKILTPHRCSCNRYF